MKKEKKIELKIVAHIHTELPTKFGIPRQSGLVKGLRGRIVFEPEYRNAEALRGLEGFSHLWLLWDFSMAHRLEWSPTVRPPRLGGNRRMGVWATRSPFRPNPIGLSSVRITSIQLEGDEGPVIEVEGVDLMDGTPILDIKPYLPYTDSHPEATSGFAQEALEQSEPLQVIIPPESEAQIPPEKIETLRQILQSDPRPQYQDDPERIYGFSFAGMEVRFRVLGKTLTVLKVVSSR